MPVHKISVSVDAALEAERLRPNKKRAKPQKKKLVVSAAVRRRFEGYLQKSKKCWSWKGSHTADGYAQFWLNDLRVVKAHRFAYEIYIRQLGKRERLRNSCANKQCVNPACWSAYMIGARKPRTRKHR